MITKYKIFEKKEEDWKLKINISKIWNESIYENVNDLVTFNDKYINFLNNQKDLIIKQTSNESWNKLQELINKLTENKNNIEKSMAIWDDIYDWADGNIIQITSKEEEIKSDF
jgi:DNA-binding transcriptional regulator GbsR (MarR family)